MRKGAFWMRFQMSAHICPSPGAMARPPRAASLFELVNCLKEMREPRASGVSTVESGLFAWRQCHTIRQKRTTSAASLYFVLFAATLWLLSGEDWLRIKTVHPLAVAAI